MIAAFKGDIHLQDNDQELEGDLAIKVNSNSGDSEDKEENIEGDEAAVKGITLQEPCVERALEDYDEHETQHDIALKMYQ